MAFTYMLRCSDGSYYVGSTVDLEQRILQHNHGGGSRYTLRRRPVVLVWAREYDRIDDLPALARGRRLPGPRR